MLLHGLPPYETALARAVLDGEQPWPIDQQLLANIAETLEWANWQRGGGKGEGPKPIPRPGLKKPEKPGLTAEQAARLRAIRPPQSDEED